MSLTPIDGDNPSKFIQANVVNLDKIYSVSKFRSGDGHDFSVGSGETCRSMKHYFATVNPDKPDYKMQGLKDVNWPPQREGYDEYIYSPVDGKIDRMAQDKNKGPLGWEMVVIPDSQPNVMIRLMHVAPLKKSKLGQKVKAGQPIGIVYANQSFDVAIEYHYLFKTTYISYFAAMQDQVFAEYQARGATSRSEFIFTRAEIDAHPWKCGGGKEQFAESYTSTPEGIAKNMVLLSGYEEMNAIMNKLREKYPKK